MIVSSILMIIGILLMDQTKTQSYNGKLYLGGLGIFILGIGTLLLIKTLFL